MTYKEIKKNKEIKRFLAKGDANLATLGYTEHSDQHSCLVAERAALIIADKTDVRRSRVRSRDKSTYDTHDWVNYAVTESCLKINKEKKQIALNLQIDEKICTMYEYFDIFLGRMQMCRHSAELFGAKFKLTANGCKVL